MRFIAYGVGAIGGVVCAALTEAGHEVIGIARGARLTGLQAEGLVLRSQSGTARYRLPCVGGPAEIAFRPDDAILLLMKSQHTQAALVELRAAGVTDQPVFCCQNGVANERLALRYFANVHGVTVMLPASTEAPNDAIAFAAPVFGLFDIGRFPSGSDGADTALARALTPGGITGFVDADVMQSKYGKLLLNLGNAVEATLGEGHGDITRALQEEARGVLEAAGIAWRPMSRDDARRKDMTPGDVDGADRMGSSTSQSLARGAGSVETDYLNGEICYLGRLHGVETPRNTYFAALAARMAHGRQAPGSGDAKAARQALGL